MDSPSIDELYHDAILDHRRNPRNNAVLDTPDASAKAVNPFCGDEVDLQLVFSDGRVSGVGVQAVGCSINQSSASMLSEAVVGKTPEEIRHLATAFEGIMMGCLPRPSALPCTTFRRCRCARVPGADQVRAAVVVGAGGRAGRVWSGFAVMSVFAD